MDWPLRIAAAGLTVALLAIVAFVIFRKPPSPEEFARAEARRSVRVTDLETPERKGDEVVLRGKLHNPAKVPVTRVFLYVEYKQPQGASDDGLFHYVGIGIKTKRMRRDPLDIWTAPLAPGELRPFTITLKRVNKAALDQTPEVTLAHAEVAEDDPEDPYQNPGAEPPPEIRSEREKAEQDAERKRVEEERVAELVNKGEKPKPAVGKSKSAGSTPR